MRKAWNKGVEWGDANCEFGGETLLPKFEQWITSLPAAGFKDDWVRLEDLAITASEMEWPDEVMEFARKLATNK